MMIKFIIPTDPRDELQPLVRQGKIEKEYPDGWMDVRVSGRIFNVKKEWIIKDPLRDTGENQS